ncbi:MAG: hypothetical protein GQ531_06510 [Sulfurovum sp.]|nr:hypothetical protein [Sulfurovum sp.]
MKDEEAIETQKKNDLKTLYKKYHPHPMLVHFPIALHFFAGALDILFFFLPKSAFASAIFYTFFAAVVTGFFAMIPGIFSWWINYKLSWTRIFIVKLLLSVLNLLLGLVAIEIYWQNPEVVFTLSLQSVLYHSIVLITMVFVTIVAYYGAKLTWSKKDVK